MAHFELNSNFAPAGDQPEAIDGIVRAFKGGAQFALLEGVTGSGKTFTMANVIARLGLPTLIMTHNKSLAAQLYSEFRGFFPRDHVEYFISYYDYYQPEAYIPRQDLFIEKDSAINDELERLRLSTTASLLSYDNCVVVASVSANYGLGNPAEYKGMVQIFVRGEKLRQKELLHKLVDMGYTRNDAAFDRGDFRVNGDVVDIFPAYSEDEVVRVEFFGDEIDEILLLEPLTNKRIRATEKFVLFASSQFIVGEDRLAAAIRAIEDELAERLAFFKAAGKVVEFQRLKQRVEFDLEMLRATGMTKGIENYARHLTGQGAGETPYSLFDYFGLSGGDFLVIVDESHVSLPQFRGMFAGDRSRKEVLVEYGFRLPSALDNRPLMFDEFIGKTQRGAKFLFVSATPNELEIKLAGGAHVEQILRPTGLLDPVIEVKPSENQVEVLYDEIRAVTARGERVLVTTLTKKMSEELTKYYGELGVKIRYMHSDIDAIERNELIRDLRLGRFDVLVGINLLREGLDLPEVSLVAVLDADKEGFLRSRTSLIQTMGRAARNEHGRVILFASHVTRSMQEAMDVTTRRRELQEAFNRAHNITPRSVRRNVEESLSEEAQAGAGELYRKGKKLEKLPAAERAKMVQELRKEMLAAAAKLEFEKAAALRDEIAKLRTL